MPAHPQDTGLLCPSCGYNLTLLTTNRCPECGKPFVLAKPGVVASMRSCLSNSMPCPECGYNNTGFMPRHCRHCQHRFTWMQRIFGVGGRMG